jgi:methylmalonyl-CoA mutase N-terminal domain/subunit
LKKNNYNNYEEWKEKLLEPFVNINGERKTTFNTLSNQEVQPTYHDPEKTQQEFPGEFPYTRGIYPSMYRSRLWTMRQYSGFSNPEKSNERFKHLLEQGQNGISVAFDLPTQIGYDSDNNLAESEVGKVGVPIDTLADMESLFKDIALDTISTSMTINATAPILLAMYVALAKKQNVPLENLRGTLQNDILKEYIARGTYIYPPQQSMKLITDVFEYCSKELPKWNPISISGYHIREAGSTAIQELAFTFSNAIEYIKSALQGGLTIDEFCPQISFFFVSQNNLIEEVAKYRAARRIWARITKEMFNSQNPKSSMLRFHVQTAGVTLTAQQPDNNIIRSTIQALAAVLGGAQSLHVNSKDEALGLPSESSAIISLRTQQIIALESGVADTVDPLGGSYYLEKLTDDIEKEAFNYIDRIESMGGALKALESQYQEDEIENSAYMFQQELENKERFMVGVNTYQEDSTEEISFQKISRKEIKQQIQKLSSVKKNRNQSKVTKSLENLENVANTKNNIMPAIIEAVESYSTIGEISDIFRKIYGEYSPDY